MQQNQEEQPQHKVGHAEGHSFSLSISLSLCYQRLYHLNSFWLGKKKKTKKWDQPMLRRRFTKNTKTIGYSENRIGFHHMLKGSEGTAAVRSRARAQVFDWRACDLKRGERISAAGSHFFLFWGSFQMTGIKTTRLFATAVELFTRNRGIAYSIFF